MKPTLTQKLALRNFWLRLKHDFENLRRAWNGLPTAPYRKPDLKLKDKFRR